MAIHLSWSRRIEGSPTSVDVSSNLFLVLRNWLQELDYEVVRIMRTEDPAAEALRHSSKFADFDRIDVEIHPFSTIRS